MSVLSDDTDVLLLIPPEFFLVPSDSEENLSIKKPNERLLVSDLITQVNDLEGRICLIENQNFINNMPAQGNLKCLRHFGSADTLHASYKSSDNSRSLQTTPMKTQTLPSPRKSWRTRVNRSPLTNSKRLDHQNILTSHEYVNQREKDEELLKEIHNFFKQRNIIYEDNDSNDKVKNDETCRSETIGDENVHLSAAVFNLNKVNDLLKQLEETQAEIEQKLKLKGLNDVEDEDFNKSDKKLPDNVNFSKVISSEILLDNKSPKRFLNFENLSPKKSEGTILDLKEQVEKVSESLDIECFEANQDIYKTINADQKSESQSSPEELPKLLSLCTLWGSCQKEDETRFEDQKILKQKFLEEKCRRQHCEELIKKLQLRLLEEQQKVAVALKVDKDKDEAISKLMEGWNKLVGHWRELENQKNILGKKVIAEREKFQNEISNACQTVKRYEVELSKALDLAHGYKEKCESSERERENFSLNATKEIEALKNELREMSDKLQKEKEQNDKLEKFRATNEEILTQTKLKLIEGQNQVRDLKKILKDQQTEMEILRRDKEKLTEKVKEEKNRVSLLEQNKKNLLQINEDLKKKEKSLKENIKSLTEQMEKIKGDLKEFYQEQVEKIVQEKLKEFQEQLATAEKTLQTEIEEREKKMTEMAVKQVQQIVEKHVVEVNLLEEKHNEEIELWKIKVLRGEEKIQELQKKLDSYSSHKTEIAQKLQSVMETQWQEALKIITAGSPEHQKGSLCGEVNCANSAEKELTRQNTFTLLSCDWGDGELNKSAVSLARESSTGLLQDTVAPFSKNEDLTSWNQCKNDKFNYRIDETPQKMTSESSDSLKKYIQMLLERPPGVPLDDSNNNSFDDVFFNNFLDRTNFMQWQQILSETSSQINCSSSKEGFFKAAKEKEIQTVRK